MADNPSHASQIPGVLSAISKKFSRFGVVIEEKVIDFSGCNIDDDPHLEELKRVLDHLSPSEI